ncbi:molybdopterin-dependent oxidoreductase [Streptomyces sp. B6B3]|uniref:molybdopterin-dependent oxidoreductase n=1 Tax=Streptomyces sp. B6B3 TaxID=3153570 RepID=UPI00325C7CA0
MDANPEPSRPRSALVARVGLAALCGLLAAGAGLAAAEFATAAARPEASPVTAVGGVVIDHTPAAVKDWAIETFGTADKLVLRIGIVILLALYAAGLGLLAAAGPRARRTAAVVGALLFGVVGAVAAASRSGAGAEDAVPSLLGGAVAAGVLVWLTRRLVPHEDAGPGDAGFDRRAFLVAATSTAAASAGVGLLGRALRSADDAAAEASRSAVRLPAADSPAGPVPAGARLRVAGLSPFRTPTDDFYRIDTALRVPRVDAETWRLTIRGAGVSRPLTLGFRQLLRRELVERDITLTCVSNLVGGDLVGNARWIGVRLADLLREAGVRPPSEGGPADQLVARSVDGMTLGSPVETVMDGRDALLAVGMDGEPLPFEHGFPVRMVVPGLYGYVSACKWLTELELTTFADYDAYWVGGGWAERGPIKTQSRIDTPDGSAPLRPGPVPVAGVAWAQNTGIERVEVRVDDGPWHEARLADEHSVDTWRQWVWEWPATSGSHVLRVRATDRSGATQTARSAPPAPDGATGHHEIRVEVE